VLADVLGGFVSPARAEADYGVVLAAGGRSIDRAATLRRRAGRPETKMFHRKAYADALD
jgi:hypothetical protein